MQSVFIGEDNLIQLDGVKSAASGALITTATISGQLKSEDLSTSVGSAITFAATAVSGQYQGTLLAATPLVLGSIYFLDISISGSLTGLRRVKCRAQYHQEQ